MRTRFGRFVRFTFTLGFALGLGVWQALAQVTDYTYTTNNGAITIIQYVGPGGAVTIPDMITGLPVTGIGGCAFCFHSSLTSVTIPESVTGIGGSAFYACTGLTSVTIPSSVTGIEDSAFYACTGLSSVTIPSSVTSIGDWAFSYCTSLTAITVDALNPAYSSVDGVLFDKNRTKLIQCPRGRTGSYEVPNTVIDIGIAFSNCNGLTSVTISRGVTGIGYLAFFDCTGLTNITIPSGVTNLGNQAFSHCSSLANVTIPDSVTSIGFMAFSYCTSLTNVTIPSSVTSIEAAAFSYCTSLTRVTIPSSVNSIEYAVFRDCWRLPAITVDALNPAYSSVDGVLFDKNRTKLIQYPGSKAGTYTIPNSVSYIESYAFYSCARLTGVSIPDSVTSIGDFAFVQCTSLTNVTIGKGLHTIGSQEFGNCTNLAAAYFEGDAPFITLIPGRPFDFRVFGEPTIVYHLPGTLFWNTTFGERPTALWKPSMETSDASFGVRSNQFGFNISWADDRTVVVEASTTLTSPSWQPVSTNNLIDGWSYFSDSQWTNYPSRFYRVRSP